MVNAPKRDLSESFLRRIASSMAVSLWSFQNEKCSSLLCFPKFSNAFRAKYTLMLSKIVHPVVRFWGQSMTFPLSWTGEYIKWKETTGSIRETHWRRCPGDEWGNQLHELTVFQLRNWVRFQRRRKGFSVNVLSIVPGVSSAIHKPCKLKNDLPKPRSFLNRMIWSVVAFTFFAGLRTIRLVIAITSSASSPPLFLPSLIPESSASILLHPPPFHWQVSRVHCLSFLVSGRQHPWTCFWVFQWQFWYPVSNIRGLWKGSSLHIQIRLKILS